MTTIGFMRLFTAATGSGYNTLCAPRMTHLPGIGRVRIYLAVSEGMLQGVLPCA
jgi:hypothetical protein